MKIENNLYVIMKLENMEVNNETVYVQDGDCEKFTNDITKASKFRNRADALCVKRDYEIYKHNGYESNFQIVPLRITYEW